ncbi:MAG: redoxin domain-containing protein [Gemmatimonadetes bacterium]|nr:redoxin domain-containing protein [Gemmatimonadota bacterium]
MTIRKTKIPKSMFGHAGAGIVLTAVVVVSVLALATELLVARLSAQAVAAPVAAAEQLGDIPADRWLGAPEGGLSGESLRGRVVLVEFWTYLCYNCKNVEGWMKETHATFAPRGLEVVGVHTPEFDVEKKLENVQAYIRENGIEYPVAIDNGFRVWRKYNATNAWPAFLVYDREGKLVYRKAGEGAVKGARRAIEAELAKDGPAAASGAAGSRTGVSLSTRTVRESPSRAVLELTLQPLPGYRLAKSPPNEILLDLPAGVRTPANPALLGEEFHGGDSRDVRYYERGASLTIPLELGREAASAPLTVRGTAVYRVCDDRSKVCARMESAFSERIDAS